MNIQLHGFADSSQKAYSAALYLHVQNTNNEIVYSLTIKVDEYNLWPDSTVALRWLRTSHLLQNICRK